MSSEGKITPISMGTEKDEATIYSGSASEAASDSFDVKSTRRLLRKIDLTVIPFLALLYL
jgi:hypothetical protein